MTNEELYNELQKNNAKHLEMYPADWCTEWGKPNSGLSHEISLEYKGYKYYLLIHDSTDKKTSVHGASHEATPIEYKDLRTYILSQPKSHQQFLKKCYRFAYICIELEIKDPILEIPHIQEKIKQQHAIESNELIGSWLSTLSSAG